MRKSLTIKSTRTIWLFSEFVIIVLGVLVALAVDSWNTSRRNDEVRAHLIESLLMDLREDLVDYDGFVEQSKRRGRAAQFILSTAAGDLEESGVDNMTVRDALSVVATSSRLETIDVTFSEMSALGTGSTIEDSELRLEIAHYYGLAQTREDINEMLLPAMLRYRAALEESGMSFSDREAFDVGLVLGDEKILAIVENLGWWAEIAVPYTEPLRQENRRLISKIEAISE